MVRFVKLVLTSTGVLFALIFFLLVGVIYYAKTDHALHLMQVKINESIPGTILFEDFRFSLLKGEFEFKNMLLKGPSNDELAGFDRLFVGFAWISLFRGELTVADLRLEKPWATIRVDREGGINLMRAFPPSKTQEEEPRGKKGKGVPINIVLDSLKLVEGSICYEMVAEDLKAIVSDIDLTANGNLLEQSGNFTVRIGKGTLDSRKIVTELDHFKLEATLKEGRIDPLFFQAGTTSSKLTLSGNIDDVLDKPFLDLTLDTVVSLPEVRKALCMEPMLIGQLATRLTARGTPDNPEMTWRLAYGGGILSGQQVDRIDLNCRLKNRLLALNTLQINVASGDLNLQGEVDLQDAFMNGFFDPQRDLEAISYKILLEQKGIRLEKLFPATNELRGTVSSDISLSGKGISPETLSARLRLGAFAQELVTNHLSAPIQFHMEAEANVNQGVAILEHLEASAGDIRLAAEGHLDASSEQMTARLTLDAPSLTTTLAALGIEGVSGALGLTADVSGTLEDPKITGEIALKHLQIKGKPLEDVQLHLDLHDHLARISGNLNFDVNASFDLQKKDFLASVLFDETDLTPYLKIANQPDLTGTLSGQIEARGNTEAIDQSQASVNFSKLDLFFKDNQILHSQDFKASIQGKEIRIPPIHLLLLKEGRIDINGKGKLDGPLDFQVEGNIPLRIASLFIKDLDDITGDLALSASIGGTKSHPEINGEIGLQEIAFTVPELPQRLHDLNGRIQITPQAITIHGIKGGLDTGRFDLAGKIDLEEFQPTKVLVEVTANALPLRVPNTLDMLLTTQIEIDGTREKSMIQGETTILEGTYFKDVNLSLLQMVGKKEREEAPPPAEITQPFLKNMDLDIIVTCRNPFVVDNDLANLDIHPDLRITGKLSNPIISGGAKIESGTIFYQKKEFVVKKGVIGFLNPYKIEPTLDITSEVKIRRWTIFLEISGTPDELVFKLTSDPQEEDEDILSLLLFGKTTHELIAGEGETPQTTEQMVAELIANTFGGDIKAATGLDILEVETQGEDSEEAADRIKVTVGKQLSKRMTVKYAVESEAGEMVQRTIAEYKLLENILLNAFQDSKGVFGGELQFRLDFR
jgi:autotransporter translocation and assembly factor TamB